MPLTSVRLILLAAVVTGLALAGTVLVWPRWGRWRFVLRPAGVLLTEALLVLTAGLAVNRSQEFYPSWATLFASASDGPTTFHTSAGRLDAWLAARPSLTSFPWRPTGWASWHLAAAPTVTVPSDYLAHPLWRYSAVLVIGARPWALPALPGPTVLVNVTTTAATTAPALAVALPGTLGRDLRVTSHRWALVASAADGVLARKVVAAEHGRFPALAFVGVTAPGHASGGHPATSAATRSAHSATARPPAGTSAAAHPAGAAHTGSTGQSVATVQTAGASHPEHGVGSSTAAGYDNFCPAVHSPATTKPANATHPQHGVGSISAHPTDRTSSAVHSPAAVHSPKTKAAATDCPAVTLPPGVLPAGVLTAYFPGPADKAASPLQAALGWAAAQTPPPLAASAPEPTYLPPAPKRSHPAKPKSKAVKDGPRQPRS